MGSGEAKELICIAHEHELRGRGILLGVGCRVEGNKGRKNGTTIIA